MIIRISLDNLNQDSVSVKKQQYTIIDGKEYAIGEPWRKAYVNSEQGRQEVEKEVAEPYKSVMFLMWGDTSTVDESITQ